MTNLAARRTINRRACSSGNAVPLRWLLPPDGTMGHKGSGVCLTLGQKLGSTKEAPALWC